MSYRLLCLIISLCLPVLACSPPGPPVEVSAVDLSVAYLKNAAAADRQYRGHTLIVNGMAGGTDKDGESYVLTLVPGIRAHLGSQTQGASLFQQVVVRCSGVSAENGNIDLTGCEIIS